PPAPPPRMAPPSARPAPARPAPLKPGSRPIGKPPLNPVTLPDSNDSSPATPLLGLEPTSLDGSGIAEDVAATLDIEPTALKEKPAPRPPSIIEQEASASLLPEHELLDDDTPRDPASPPEFDRSEEHTS